ncbi:hypothetical protein B0H67DRAFT_565370 [Lasiosphaeris hirsuta]|uniref:Uncharacterized protein n=1 Tax=Lasiosphaeris hirsuta TaxID=260670 RepID=A0AA40BCA4_9PEZI|nr:hypothetical protein B0H67DRAFT_565370 [Lasiosphaeris hirsuta]
MCFSTHPTVTSIPKVSGPDGPSISPRAPPEFQWVEPIFWGHRPPVEITEPDNLIQTAAAVPTSTLPPSSSQIPSTGIPRSPVLHPSSGKSSSVAMFIFAAF